MVVSPDAASRQLPIGDEEDIHVLLVDDNEQWARYAAGEIEQAEPRIAVTVALSANEALQELRSSPDIECVVSDYRMPEVTGLELLDRVRDRRSDLPFILATARGSEDVAVEAISAGVSDYVTKDSGADLASLVATRIRRVVSEYRLRRAIEASEHRYRTVTEQISEGIAVVRDGRIVFRNDAFRRLVGTEDRPDEAVEAGELFHADDGDAVEQYATALQAGRETDDQLEARIHRADGPDRHCLIDGRRIAYEGDRAALLSVRDVTERRRRRRQLERERELNKEIRERLVSAETRSELESSVCDVLCRFGYEVAWIAAPDDDRLAPRAAAGQTAVLEDLNFSTDGDAESLSAWAARARAPKFLADVGDLFASEFRERVTDFRSGCALPLVHNGVFYGVLTAYRAEPDLDGTERELLADLAEAVAFAVHTLETSRSLAADTLVAVEAELNDSSYYLPEAVADSPELRRQGTVTVAGTLRADDGAVTQYLTLEGTPPSTLAEALRDHPVVSDATVIDESEPRVRVTATAGAPELELSELGARVRQTTVTAGRTTVTFQLPATRDVRSVVDRLEDSWNAASVVSVTHSGTGEGPMAAATFPDIDLTEKQRTALEAAYHNGYFEQPRQRTASEIAGDLGVSHSTFLQHLRIAQQKVFEAQFG